MAEITTISRTKSGGQISVNVRKTSPLDRLWMSTLWIGVGALVHAWFLGPEFDSRSLWSWGYLIVWPLPMTFWFVVQILVFGAWIFAVGAILALAWWIGSLLVRAYRAHRAETILNSWLDEDRLRPQPGGEPDRRFM